MPRSSRWSNQPAVARRSFVATTTRAETLWPFTNKTLALDVRVRHRRLLAMKDLSGVVVTCEGHIARLDYGKGARAPHGPSCRGAPGGIGSPTPERSCFDGKESVWLSKDLPTEELALLVLVDIAGLWLTSSLWWYVAQSIQF